MVNTAKIFGMSDAEVSRMRVAQLVASAACTFIMLGVVGFSFGALRLNLFVFSVIVMSAGASTVLLLYQSRRIAQTHLFVGPSALVRTVGSRRHEIPLSAITRVRVYRTQEGEVKLVRIYTEGMKGMDLVGFASMGELAAAIEWALAPSDRIETRRTGFDLTNSVSRVAVVVATIAIGAGLGAASIGHFPLADRYLPAAAYLATGCIFFFSRSLSRRNPAMRALEVVLLALYLGLTAMSLS